MHLFNSNEREFFPILYETIKDSTGRPDCIVMECCDYVPPANYIFKMSYTQTQCYFKALLEALNALHSKNLVHRDVKFENFRCVIHPADASKSKYKLVGFGNCTNRKSLMKLEYHHRAMLNDAAALDNRVKKHMHELQYYRSHGYVFLVDIMNSTCPQLTGKWIR